MTAKKFSRGAAAGYPFSYQKSGDGSFFFPPVKDRPDLKGKFLAQLQDLILVFSSSQIFSLRMKDCARTGALFFSPSLGKHMPRMANLMIHTYVCK